MDMVSLGADGRLYVSKDPVRSKVAVSEDMERVAVRPTSVGAAARRRRRDVALDVNMVRGQALVARILEQREAGWARDSRLKDDGMDGSNGT